MKIKKLKKKLRKLYYNNGQMLYVNTFEYQFGDDRDNYFEVYACDEDDDNEIYLFEVFNRKTLVDYDVMPFYSYRRENRWVTIEDINKESYTPFCCGRQFFLAKDTGITNEDILMCVRYFIHVVLDDYRIWNIVMLDEVKS